MAAKLWILLGAVLGGLGVAAGAFGAHSLAERLDARELANFETGVRYQMYHALAIVAVGAIALARPSSALNVAGTCFAAGTLVFSGCLYILALRGPRIFGLVVVVGGVLFLVGWAALAVAALRMTDSVHPPS
jgi:uncharacterized membrane protein YgdD (TMEM256/DUF423 family)